MKTSLIVCTYQRPGSLRALLASVKLQTKIPDQVLIIDGSLDSRTEELCKTVGSINIEYFRVSEEQRGLTRQRNIGVEKVRRQTDIIFFLDDDTVLDPGYFEEILKTYKVHPEAVGVSGFITNEVSWKKVSHSYKPSKREYMYDGWVRTEGSRFSLRRRFGLAPNVPPGYMPAFSHGYSAAFLPPSGRIYEVEMLMGGIASYRKEVFQQINFSPYFRGYGLYEDADFSLRASMIGPLYVNTMAKVEHHHAAEGRPDMYKYGRMVVRNGWYVWRVKNPHPTVTNKIKWYSTTLLLSLIRMSNFLSKNNGKGALGESMGRFTGLTSLLYKKPKI